MPLKTDSEKPNQKLPDLITVPGFHVVKDSVHLGTYQTLDDAQAFIDSHAGEGAEIIEGEA